MKKSILKVCLFLFAFSCVLIAQKYKVDISKVKDGKYEGTHGKIIVNVSVVNNKITAITLIKNPSGPFVKSATTAFQKMIEKNDVEADAKTAATFKSVVNNALTSDKQVK